MRKLKPFNLEQALAGKPIITRDGRIPTDIYYFKSSIGIQKLLAVIDGCVKSFSDEGFYYHARDKYELDLFMQSEKKEAWINIYRLEDEISMGLPYTSEKEADEQQMENRIKCVKVEWEE